MLSYRHAFHAGNFADVLKHTVLIQLIAYLSNKDKPFCCIDSHAGAGNYYLNDNYAQKTQEFAGGIGKLWTRSDLPNSLAVYVKLIKQFNHDDCTRSVGSPFICRSLLRSTARLFLYELHSIDYKQLVSAIGKDKRVRIFHSDGLQGAISLLPPQERRGLVLIDPSYEIKTDYSAAVETLQALYKRFATGTYALWYPVVKRKRNQKLEQAIKTSGIKNVQLFELAVQADNDEHGMTACGMIIINPPWTLASDMQQVLPYLADLLGEAGAGFYRVETLVSENG